MNFRETLKQTVAHVQRSLAAAPDRAVILTPDRAKVMLGHVRVLRGLLRTIVSSAMTGQNVPGLWDAVRANVPPLEDIALEPMEIPKRTMAEIVQGYRDEGAAIEKLAAQLMVFQQVAPVDDDFPLVKHGYDHAAEALLAVLLANGRRGG